MGMTEVVESSVQQYRRKEIQSAMGFRWLSLWTNTIASAPLIFAPVLTFVVFVAQATARGTDSLSTNQAFTSLSIITLVTQPASLLMFAINESAAMKGCFDRLQKFLRAPAGSDSRTGVTGLGGSHSGNSGSEVSLSHPNGKTTREGDEKGPEASTHSTPTTVKIQQATIRPAPTVDPALSQVSMDCPEGSLTLVVGPVGCGKSTLLRAVLGELPCDAGTISVSTKDIAFCAQSPWLPNGTIKDVICGFCDEEKIDHVWFQTTIHACALEEDVSQLPQAEQTVVGSRGVTLSGGQKQRVVRSTSFYPRSTFTNQRLIFLS